MTISQACQIAVKVARPEFHGQVTMNIKDGGVSTVEIRQIVTEALR